MSDVEDKRAVDELFSIIDEVASERINDELVSMVEENISQMDAKLANDFINEMIQTDEKQRK